MYVVRSSRLDQFYTKSEIALQCVENLKQIISFQDYSLILEPSAGEGVFLDLLPENKRIGIDLAPARGDIIQQDFFDYFPLSEEKILVVGNPPFGAQSSLATRFFNHAGSFADTIAFIIPIIWKKWSLQRRLDDRYRLIHTQDLPKDAFIFKGESYSVPCAFQIWTRNPDTLPNINLRIVTAPITKHKDFEFLPKSKLQAADFLFVVCGARKQLIHDIDSPIAIQTTERIKCHSPKVRRAFEQIDWTKYFQGGNTGSMWINRETIVKEYQAWADLQAKPASESQSASYVLYTTDD
jgi:hypothetical protein